MSRFIVADDVSDTRARLAKALADHEVTTVGSGWELLELLADGHGDDVDVVITDARMGFPDGLTVATFVRATGIKTPFLVLGGIANERARKVAAGLGDVVLLEPPAGVDRITQAAIRLAARGVTAEPRWVHAAELFEDHSSDNDD